MQPVFLSRATRGELLKNYRQDAKIAKFRRNKKSSYLLFLGVLAVNHSSTCSNNSFSTFLAESGMTVPGPKMAAAPF